MTDPIIPKLTRYYLINELTGVGSSAGAWLTKDHRFGIHLTQENGWIVTANSLNRVKGKLIYETRPGWDQDNEVIERHGLNGRHFKTRREALKALALALHLETERPAS